MSMTDSLLATIIGTLAVWLITTSILHQVKKAKLRAALLTDIKINIDGVREQRVAVAKLVENHAVEGNKLPFPISYRVGEYLFYKSIQHNLVDYLNKAELLKVIRFYQKIWELDSAINGLASTMSKWERDGTVLSKANVEHIIKRKERIDSFCEIICANEIRGLMHLSDDYEPVKGPETVVN